MKLRSRVQRLRLIVRHFSESGTGSGEEKTKVENNLDNEVKKALNRSGTAEKVDESKTEGIHQKETQEAKGQRGLMHEGCDFIAHWKVGVLNLELLLST